MNKKRRSINIDWIEGNPVTAHEKFHDHTKWTSLEPAPEVKDWPDSWKTIYYKEYPRLDKVILPDPDLKPYSQTSYLDVQLKRFSVREFSSLGLDLQQISDFLYLSAGIKKNHHPYLENRYYPSPGGRYSLELYLISPNSSLSNGVYHYNTRGHYLEALDFFSTFEFDNYFNQDWIKGASVLIVAASVFYRNTVKYGERGYRHVLVESGHLGQNFYLNAAARDLAACAVGGYHESNLEKLLDLDGVKESVVYVFTVGNKLSSG